MFKFLKKIDPQKAFDTVASGIDKAFYTKEEQSDDAKAAWAGWFEWYKNTLDESSIRSITRRILAVMFSSVFLVLFIAAAVFYKFDKEYALFLFELAKELGVYVGGIMLFYFGYYGIKNIVQTSKKQKK